MSYVGGKVAVVGIGHSKIRRRAIEPLGKVAVDACTNAIEDAGLKISDIDGIASAIHQPFEVGEPEIDGHNFVSPKFVVEALSLDVGWTDAIQTTGMVGTSLINAIGAVGGGLCKYAVVYRPMYNPVGRRYGFVSPASFSDGHQFTGSYGIFGPARIGHFYTRYMHQYGAKREQMAAFCVRNREYALKFPDGYWSQNGGKSLTIEDYMGARMISDPICLHDCDIPVQGCAAWVVTTAERAKDLKHHPAYVLGTGGIYSLDPPGPNAYGMVRTLEQYQENGRRQAKALWRSSGIGPKDVDVLNVYDGFSIMVPLWVESLGFCKEGEAFEFIANPPLPLNTSAGNLGSGRMHGTPHLVDSALQVMGRAGARQVPGAEIAVAVTMPSPGEGIVFSSSPN